MFVGSRLKRKINDYCVFAPSKYYHEMVRPIKKKIIKKFSAQNLKFQPIDAD